MVDALQYVKVYMRVRQIPMLYKNGNDCCPISMYSSSFVYILIKALLI